MEKQVKLDLLQKEKKPMFRVRRREGKNNESKGGKKSYRQEGGERFAKTARGQ